MTARHRDLGGADAPGPEPAAEPGVRRGGPRRTIRFRLLLILAVPTGALVVLASLGVLTQLQVYRQAERTVQSVQLTLVAQDFIHELQRERGLTNGLLGDAKEATALQRGFLNGVFSAGSFRDREFVGFTEIRARKLAAFDAYARDATANQQATLDAALRSPAATEARGYEQRGCAGLRRVSPAGSRSRRGRRRRRPRACARGSR